MIKIEFNNPAADEVRKLGRWLTYGVLDVLCVIILVGWLLTALRPADSTDRGRWFWQRSGLRIYTDHATGVQYLGTTSGALVPRVDHNGKPIVIP